MVYKTSKQERERSLRYYYNNRDKVLAYQKARWKKKYQTDPAFRTKRQFRDKSRNLYGLKITEPCISCGSRQDLQRHHPSYDSYKVVILCKSCHDDVHHPFRERNTQVSKAVDALMQ